MKKLLAFTALLVIVLVIIIPALLVRLDFTGPAPNRGNKVFTSEDISIRVYLPETNKIVEMNLEDYIKGVVAAEMPAEFELEALKAQAVAARTVAVKSMASFGGSGVPEHPGADVSADFKQSQAWLGEARLRERWGDNYGRYWARISQAVDQTRGQIITYAGEPINAVFHSTSGGRTASAKEVWGFEYPYLQSVACTWDQTSPRYNDTKEIPLAEIEQRLGPDAGVMSAAKNGSGAVAHIIDLTDSGRVDKIRIGSKVLSGIAAREKLELRSANFTVEQSGDKMIFKTIGYGHGVGLCQYGANGMAKEGRDYHQIVTYYYTGVALTNIFGS
ncbi:MAG: stage II sporulation protein D [Veillonellales bacterium]